MSAFSDLRIGVLALQGAFAEHVRMIRACGAHAEEIRKPLSGSPSAGLDVFDGIILPGGESTVMGKLLVEWGLMDALRARIAEGMPVYGSCAGLILLCRDIEGPGGERLEQPRIGLLDATARRNAFGRQADSFECPLRVEGLEGGGRPLPAVFIRAPLVTRVGAGVEVLAEVAKTDAVSRSASDSMSGPASGSVAGPVALRQGTMLATSFHPELTPDTRMHRLFLTLAARAKA